MKIHVLTITLLFLIYSVVLGHTSPCAGEEILLFEDFKGLGQWEPFTFPKIKEHSRYTIVEPHLLRAESQASASAIRYKEQFNVYDYPRVEWRWKVENIYQQGDAKSKQGDDYPLRVYIVFKYDPEKAGFRKNLKYNTAKALYGEYPPHSSLNYIWANQEHEEEILPNTYADEAQMILVQKGAANVNVWQVEHVNIVEDYRRAFGEDPPEIASIVIMNDSDNTKEQAVSYVDYLKIYR